MESCPSQYLFLICTCLLSNPPFKDHTIAGLQGLGIMFLHTCGTAPRPLPPLVNHNRRDKRIGKKVWSRGARVPTRTATHCCKSHAPFNIPPHGMLDLTQGCTLHQRPSTR